MCERFWDMDPTRFAFGLMTRAKAITYDNLALRAPEFVAEIDRLVARDVRNQGFDVDVAKPAVPMFQPFRLRGMTLEQPRRRLADGPVFGGGRHADRLASRASRQPRDRRRRADLHRDGVRLGGCAHHARLHRPLQRRAGGGIQAHRRFRPRQFGGEVLPPARPRGPQRRDQADVGGHGPAAARRARGRSSRPRPSRTIRTARCRAK